MYRRDLWGKIVLGTFLLAGLLGTLFLAAWNNTSIPKLDLIGEISGMEDKSDERKIAFSYRDGDEQITGYAKIKIQGSSSLAYEKKNYTVKLYSNPDCDEKMPVDLGWGAQNKYCLKANWVDRTHARNLVTANLAAQAQEKYGLLTQTPNNGCVDGFPVEVYANGRFLGLYTWNIPKDAWMFAMDEDDPNHLLLSGQGWEEANYFRAMPGFDTWSMEVGEESEKVQEKLDRLFDFVMNSSDQEFRDHFSEYLNLDAALNYYVISDIAYLHDNLGKNMLLATYDGQVWYLCLYDLDTSWGTTNDGLGLVDYQDRLLDLSANLLLERMEQCFPRELAQRYFELRAELFSDEHILAEFDRFREEIPRLTFAKEILRWGEGTIPSRADLPGFDYDQIREYLSSVGPRLDAKYTAWRGENTAEETGTPASSA